MPGQCARLETCGKCWEQVLLSGMLMHTQWLDWLLRAKERIQVKQRLLNSSRLRFAMETQCRCMSEPAEGY